MYLSDHELKEGSYFIAMEYHTLILNRTFLIIGTQSHMIGVIVNGLVASEHPTDPFANLLLGRFVISEDLENPMSYVVDKYLDELRDVDLLSDDLVKHNSANFAAKLENVSNVTFDRKKKWGMGNYPHDGKIRVKMDGKTREFIILGNQSCAAVAAAIQVWKSRASAA